MKCSHFVNLISLSISFIWKVVIFSVILDFTGSASTINRELEMIFLNALFS